MTALTKKTITAKKKTISRSLHRVGAALNAPARIKFYNPYSCLWGQGVNMGRKAQIADSLFSVYLRYFNKGRWMF